MHFSQIIEQIALFYGIKNFQLLHLSALSDIKLLYAISSFLP